MVVFSVINITVIIRIITIVQNRLISVIDDLQVRTCYNAFVALSTAWPGSFNPTASFYEVAIERRANKYNSGHDHVIA